MLGVCSVTFFLFQIWWSDLYKPGVSSAWQTDPGKGPITILIPTLADCAHTDIRAHAYTWVLYTMCFFICVLVLEKLQWNWGGLSSADWILFSVLATKVHELGVGTWHWHFVNWFNPMLHFVFILSFYTLGGLTRKNSSKQLLEWNLFLAGCLGPLKPVSSSELIEVNSEVEEFCWRVSVHQRNECSVSTMSLKGLVECIRSFPGESCENLWTLLWQSRIVQKGRLVHLVSIMKPWENLGDCACHLSLPF